MIKLPDIFHSVEPDWQPSLKLGRLEAQRFGANSYGTLALKRLSEQTAVPSNGRSVQQDVVNFMVQAVSDQTEITEMKAAELGSSDQAAGL